jgi:ubiquitin-like domain-containing CTD phosphatase 1
MANVLKIDGDMESIDCLMTTICTDRLLPDAINDYTGDGSNGRQLHSEDSDGSDGSDDSASPESYGKNLFQRLYDFGVKRYTLSYLANDAEYSKLGMGPLWAEIMANINGIINEETEICCPRRSPAKLALFSGHDTTIIPLLASLGPKVWDGQWPSYASMMLIEIHEVNIDGRTDKSMYKSNYAFRLLLDGKVLTHTLDGCPDDAELCDADVFIKRVTPFAKNERECAPRHGRPEEYTDTVSRAKEILSTGGGVIAFALLVVGSALVGALGTFFYLTGAMPTRRQGRTSAVESYEEGGIALTSYENGDGYSDEAEASYGSQSRAAESAALAVTIT